MYNSFFCFMFAIFSVCLLTFFMSFSTSSFFLLSHSLHQFISSVCSFFEQQKFESGSLFASTFA
jgi:hypothetical protein